MYYIFSSWLANGTVMTAVVGRTVLGPENLVHTTEDGVARLAAGGEGGGGVAVAHSQPGRVVAASCARHATELPRLAPHHSGLYLGQDAALPYCGPGCFGSLCRECTGPW